MSLEYIDAAVIIAVVFGALFVISKYFKSPKTTSNKAKDTNLVELQKITELNTIATKQTLDRKDKELNAYRQKNFQMEKKLSEVLGVQDADVEEDDEDEEPEYPPLTMETLNWPVLKKMADQYGFNGAGLENPFIKNIILEQLNTNESYRKIYDGLVSGQITSQSQDIASGIPKENFY